MTISEAIRLLQKDIDDPGSVDIMDVAEAEKLGIEALKRIKACREPEGGSPLPLLKGETEG